MPYYVHTTREMLAAASEVGATPFLLFQYYLTWATASGGIKPSLARIGADLGMKKNAICNLRARLIKAGWIRLENDEIFILKSFTKNERFQNKNEPKKAQIYSQNVNEPFTKNEYDRSQNVNDHSQKMNESFTKCESLNKEENKQLEITKNKQREREDAGAKKATRLPNNFALSLPLISWAENLLIPKEICLETETEKFRNHYTGLPPDNPKAMSSDWDAVWKNWILRAKAYFEKNEKQNGKNNQSSKSNGVGNTESKSAGKRTNRDKLAEYDAMFAKYEVAEQIE